MTCLWCDELADMHMHCPINCGTWWGVCAFHYGFHFAYQVLNPPCPGCSARAVAAAIPDVPPLTWTRTLVKCHG